MEFGNVQRAVLGVEGAELNGNVSKELNLDTTQGFYVSKVNKNSGADEGGIQKGDVIVKLDNQNVNTFSELTSYINSKRPNDVVDVTIIRSKKTLVLPVKLIKREIIVYEIKGLEVENLNDNDKKNYNLSQGVKISNITSEQLRRYQDDLLGGIIVGVNGNKIENVATLSDLLDNNKSNQNLTIELITVNKQKIRILL